LDRSVFLDILGAGTGGVVDDGGIGVDSADRLIRPIDVDAWLKVRDGAFFIDRTIVAIVVVLSLLCGHVL